MDLGFCFLQQGSSSFPFQGMIAGPGLLNYDADPLVEARGPATARESGSVHPTVNVQHLETRFTTWDDAFNRALAPTVHRIAMPLGKHVSLGRSRSGGMAENKTKPTKLSVAAFINGLTDETRRADARTLVKLMQRATCEKPKMWGPSIIGFGSVHYRYETGREGDMPLLCFSPRKAATVIYSMGFSAAEPLLAKLGTHTTGKGCLYIKKLADVDQKVMESLIAKSLAAMRARCPN